jgi:hypothetical protein
MQVDIGRELTTFKIDITSTFDKLSPSYSIWLDDDQIVKQSNLIDGQIYTSVFEKMLEHGDHVIKIRVDENPGYRGMINVENISINNKNLDHYRLYLLSHYITDQPHEIDGVMTNKLSQCVNLGWSGTYYLPISAPLIYWFLEHCI